MSDSSKAVFLSYASQDTEAAKRIADALRAAGVEVWFDQSELVGGDAWDAKIRKQIAECALFVPIISANTQARGEGYFRLEWKLAVDRSHLMAHDQLFLLPVVIDATADAAARVPPEFKAVQWTRLPGGETTEKFRARVKRLLGGAEPEASPARSAQRDGGVAAPGPRPPSRSWSMAALAGVVLLVAVAAFFTLRPRRSAGEAAKPFAAAGVGAANAAAKSAPAPTAVPLTEARKLERQARALMDDDPLAVRENFKAAVELGERAAALSPDDGEIWATLARANLALIRYYGDKTDVRNAAARSQVERAIRLAPESIEAGLAMAWYELNTNPSPAAGKARLIRLLERAPAERRVLRQLIRGATDEEDLPEAGRWLARAEALPGGDARALVYMGWLHWGLNQLPEVLALVDRSLALQPTTDAYHLKLMGLYVSGNLAGARAFLAQVPASILQEDRVAIIAYQIWLYSREPDKALAVLSQVPRDILEEGRYFGVRGYMAGEALLLAAKPRAAEAEFRAALKAVDERRELTPRDNRLMYYRARILAQLGDKAEATRCLELAREVDGRTDNMNDAEASVLLGRVDEAIVTIDRTINRERTRWPSALLIAQRSPAFDPMRSDPRLQAIIARGEAWLREMMGRSGEAAGAKSASTGSAPAVKPDDKSVAVLAFANLSDDKANEYFSDGISEELLNVLAKVPGLKVTARTSSFHFKGTNTAIPEIAKQLGVAYVVEGSVRKAGDKVRITAQLIKAADGFHVWSDTFTRDLKDIFAVQDEIAGIVAKNLSLQLGMATARPAHETNPEALALLMQGRHFWSLRTREGFARAGGLYAQVIKLDPEWARGYAALANLQVIEASFRSGDGEDMSELYAQSERNALRAIELEPNLADAYAALGKLATDRRQWAKSAEYLGRALALDPNSIAAQDWSADLQMLQGRLDLALAGYRRALELDPLSPFVLFDTSWALLHLRRFEEMKPLIGRAVELTPGSRARLGVRQAHALLRLGFRDEAARVLRPALARLGEGEDGAQVSEAVWCLTQLGWDEELARLTAKVLSQPQAPFSKGLLLMARGRAAEAYPHLQQATPIMQQVIYYDPAFDPVRETPAFKQLLRTLGCEDEHSVARETLARLLRQQEMKK